MTNAKKKLLKLEQRLFSNWKQAVTQLVEARQKLLAAEPPERDERQAIFEMLDAQCDAAWEHWHTATAALDEVEQLSLNGERNGR